MHKIFIHADDLDKITPRSVFVSNSTRHQIELYKAEREPKLLFPWWGVKANNNPDGYRYLNPYIKEFPTIDFGIGKEVINDSNVIQHLIDLVNDINRLNKTVYFINHFQYNEKAIEGVVLTGKKLVNISPLSQLTAVKSLCLQNSGITDLTPLSQMKQLKRLDIANTPVKDLSPIKNLPNLEELIIANTEVEDLSPLENINSLEYLDIRGTRVANLSPLKKLAKLYRLLAKGTEVSDVSPLSDMKIILLNLADTNISDITPLPNSISYLSLANTIVSDISATKNMKHLKTFYYYDTPAYYIEIFQDVSLFIIAIFVYILIKRKIRKKNELKSKNRSNIGKNVSLRYKPLPVSKTKKILFLSEICLVGFLALLIYNGMLADYYHEIPEYYIRFFWDISLLIIIVTPVFIFFICKIRKKIDLKSKNRSDTGKIVSLSCKSIPENKTIKIVCLSAICFVVLCALLAHIDASVSNNDYNDRTRNYIDFNKPFDHETPVVPGFYVQTRHSDIERYLNMKYKAEKSIVRYFTWRGWMMFNDQEEYSSLYPYVKRFPYDSHGEGIVNMGIPNAQKQYLELHAEIRRLNKTENVVIEPSHDGNDLDGVLLSGKELVDFSPLLKLSKLKSLRLQNTGITDLSLLSQLHSLTRLDISNTRIKDFSLLKNFHNLEVLIIANTDIEDLSPLTVMKSLTTLNISNTKVSDLSPLKDLKELRILLANSTKISDAAPLSSLPLQRLNLADTNISDISPLPHTLQALSLVNTPVSNISALDNMEELYTLYYCGTPAYYKEVLRNMSIFALIIGAFIFVIYRIRKKFTKKKEQDANAVTAAH